MKKKILLFLLMTALMLLSLVNLASAAGEGNRRATVIEATCSRLPDIRVIVPSTMEVLINPYQIPVDILDKKVDDQIIASQVALKNESEVPLVVSVSITTAIKENSDMMLAADSTIGQGLTSKRAFLFFEIQAVSDPNQVAWNTTYDEEKHLLIRTGTKTRRNMVTLGAEGKALSYGAFRVSGDCVSAPRSAWTDSDGIDVSIAFTFKATENAPQE